jgi:hypothetical protein
MLKEDRNVEGGGGGKEGEREGPSLAANALHIHTHTHSHCPNPHFFFVYLPVSSSRRGLLDQLRRQRRLTGDKAHCALGAGSADTCVKMCDMCVCGWVG